MSLIARSPKRVLFLNSWEEPGQVLGIRRYAHDAGWSVRAEGSSHYQTAADWKPDGIICQLHPDTPQLVDAVRAARVPAVELHSYIPDMKTPRVMVDRTALGRMAAEHFLERKFKRLIHLGKSSWRKLMHHSASGFLECTAEAGTDALLIDFDDPAFWSTLGITISRELPWESTRLAAEALASWIVRNDEPAGVFCCWPQFALDLVDAGVDLELHIPGQFAVLMESEAPHESELARIPVSRILNDFETQGRLAAQTLNRMMHGESVPEEQWVPPLPMEVHESTDTVATRFLPAAVAMKHFRRHALEYDFNPVRAAEDLGVSLPTLHRWLKNFAGQTPGEMIEDRRVKHAMFLMQHQRIGMEDAARQSGFSELRQLRRAIKRRFGTELRTIRGFVLDPPAPPAGGAGEQSH